MLADPTSNSPGLAFGINSALGFASAQLFMAALHEAGHGLAPQSLGFSPRIYAFYENNPTGTTAQDLVILSAGPLTSLLLGVVLYLWYRSGKAADSFGRLLLFWMAWLGIMTFVNYLMVTPFMSPGDTAQIADRLGWPAWPRFGVFALAIVCVVLLARPAAESMFQLAPAQAFATPRSRRRFVLGGFYLPLIAGTVLTALAGIGGKLSFIGLGLLGTFGNIVIVVAALYAARAGIRREWAAGTTPMPSRVEPAAVALYLALVLVYVFVFSHGMPI